MKKRHTASKSAIIHHQNGKIQFYFACKYATRLVSRTQTATTVLSLHHQRSLNLNYPTSSNKSRAWLTKPHLKQITSKWRTPLSVRFAVQEKPTILESFRGSSFSCPSRHRLHPNPKHSEIFSQNCPVLPQSSSS